MNPQAYKVAELRSYLDDKQVVNSRVKLSIDDGNPVDAAGVNDEPAIQWIDKHGINDLVYMYQKFILAAATTHDCVEIRGDALEMNATLAPLRPSLADNPDDRATLGKGGVHDLRELFALQFRRAFTILDSIYSIAHIVRTRNAHKNVPSMLDYQLQPAEVETTKAVRDFLSAPALLIICNNILQKFDETDLCMSQTFLDLVVLDLEALLRNIPLPSYVASQEYRKKLKETFPPPDRTYLNPTFQLPGSFPETDEQRELAWNPVETTIPKELSLKAQTSGSPRPLIHRREHKPLGCLRADIFKIRIDRITPGQYNRTFHQHSEAHGAIANNYVTDFDPKIPLKPSEVGTISSILKNRKRALCRNTPKRLTTKHASKSVRFSESTLSPKPRTHAGFEIPRTVDHLEEFELACRKYRGEDGPEEYSDDDSVAEESRPPFRLARQGSDCDLRMWTPAAATKEMDFTQSVAKLLAIPSLSTLAISDETKDGIETQKKEAARKAAEEARLVEEAARRETEEKARRELEERLARSGGLRVPRESFVTEMSPQWLRRALSTLDAPATAILATTSEGTDLRRHDFKTLVPMSEWLNDEIVNGSLNWLDNAINSAAGIKNVKAATRKCLSMSSFFFKRLREQGVKNTQRALRRQGVDKMNFLDVDTILLPICERSHWTLLVVQPKKRTIAHMDSLNARGNQAYTNIARAWVKDVLEEKFVEDEWKVMLYESPMQVNGNDCGVHTITNGICLALGLNPIDSYKAADMPVQRIRIACVILNGGFSGDFDLRMY